MLHTNAFLPSCLQVGDAVFDHCFMLTSRHLDRMAGRLPDAIASPSLVDQPLPGSENCGASASASGPVFRRPVTPWHFEQYQDEAVFIPAGCPHQVGKGSEEVSADDTASSPPTVSPGIYLVHTVRFECGCT